MGKCLQFGYATKVKMSANCCYHSAKQYQNLESVNYRMDKMLSPPNTDYYFLLQVACLQQTVFVKAGFQLFHNYWNFSNWERKILMRIFDITTAHRGANLLSLLVSIYQCLSKFKYRIMT
jgi:hypothetical protein